MATDLTHEMESVFVYGTLRRGDGNHWVLNNNGKEPAIFLGEAITAGRMVEAGYPIILPPTGDGQIIVGEVWKVTKTTLAALDRMESHPDMYERKATIVHIGGEGTQRMENAWAYWIGRRTQESTLLRYARPIPHGDWLRYMKERGW